MTEDLFSKTEKDYGNIYKDHLFEQYKLYVESIEKTSDRRQHANNYFLTINTALISLIGLSFQFKIFENVNWIKALLAIVGIIICIVFWFLIRSYNQLNTGKFKVIHEIGKVLPLALYKYEWEILGKGEDKSKYYPFSHIELLIPWTFGLIYTALEIYFIVLALS
jgi:NhaP-type Na+/H+ or K+/H+ antiporter